MKAVTGSRPQTDIKANELSQAEIQLVRAFRAMEASFASMWLDTGMRLIAKPDQNKPELRMIVCGDE